MSGMGGLAQGLQGVIGPALPKRKTLVLLVVGFLLGLLWAYVVAPVGYYDADPSTLRQGYQDEWIKLLADRQAATNADLTNHIADMLRYIDDPLGALDRLLSDPAEAENWEKLEAIRPAAIQAQSGAAQAPEPSTIGNIIPFIIGPIVLLVVALLFGVLWNLLIHPLIQPQLARAGVGRRGGPGAVSNEQAATEIRAIREAKQALATSKTDFSDTLGQPLMQKMSMYVLGRGQYDDSFSIEDEHDRFLGECGAGVSETIGVGDPQKVTAIEVWLFDKDDFVRTVTKVFCSQHAFNDPALRSRLEAKGDLVLAEPGAIVTLETASLRLQARVVDMQYGTGPLPPNSYFDKMTIELAAWRKQPGSQPARPAALDPMAEGAYVPPSTTSAGASRPAIVGGPPAPSQASPAAPAPTPNPYAPPPARPAPYTPPAQPPPRRQPDDDPFGGTGDFTPIT